MWPSSSSGVSARGALACASAPGPLLLPALSLLLLLPPRAPRPAAPFLSSRPLRPRLFAALGPSLPSSLVLAHPRSAVPPPHPAPGSHILRSHPHSLSAAGHRPGRFLDPPSESGYHFLQHSPGNPPPPLPLPLALGSRVSVEAPPHTLLACGGSRVRFLYLRPPPPGGPPICVCISGEPGFIGPS